MGGLWRCNLPLVAVLYEEGEPAPTLLLVLAGPGQARREERDLEHEQQHDARSFNSNCPVNSFNKAGFLLLKSYFFK